VSKIYKTAHLSDLSFIYKIHKTAHLSDLSLTYQIYKTAQLYGLSLICQIYIYLTKSDKWAVLYILLSQISEQSYIFY
jgi:hypothetical protein